MNNTILESRKEELLAFLNQVRTQDLAFTGEVFLNAHGQNRIDLIALFFHRSANPGY